MDKAALRSTIQRAKVMFDLNGFIVVRNLLSPDELQGALYAIKKNEGRFQERREQLRNTSAKSVTDLSGDGKTGRFDLGGLLNVVEDLSIFRKMMVHPKLTPYLNMLLGEGFRLDHDPVVIKQKFGSEGFSLHGGPIKPSGEMDRSLTYQCVNRNIHNSLIGVSFQLTDHRCGDGGFCVVSGSHKMNFPLTEDMMHGLDKDFFKTAVSQPETKAGDCVIFSEATVHGCLAWKNKDVDRLIALYRYAPATCAYARGYTNWPDDFKNGGATAAEVSILEPPYHPRFDRQTIEDGIVQKGKSRSKKKKEFDLKVFNRTYF